VVDAGDFCEVFGFGAVSDRSAKQQKEGIDILLHVFSASISKHLRGARSVGNTTSSFHHLCGCTSRIAPILPETLQTSGHHLLEPNDQNAVRAAMADNISCDCQASGTSRAVVVDVEDWYLGHAELIKDSLAAGGIAVTIASNALVDIIVIDLGIEHSLHTSFEPQLSVINLASRLDEFGHAYAKDVAWLVSLDDHLEGSYGRGG
jgi:hypothetical protein